MHGKKHGGKGKTRSSAGLRGRIWIDGGEGTFLGYGRIVLLEKIEEFGSITKAAKAMEISYRHAWELVDSMNRQASHLLVESSAGGKNGGGARLTEEGKKAISLFWKFYDDFQEFLKQEEGRLGVSLGKKRVSLKENDRISEGFSPKHDDA